VDDSVVIAETEDDLMKGFVLLLLLLLLLQPFYGPLDCVHDYPDKPVPGR